MAPTLIFFALAAAIFIWQPHGVSERITLLPQPDGRFSAVSVKSINGAEVLLDHPYAVADLPGGGKIKAENTTAADVRAKYSATLAAMPPRPVSFIVHFVVSRTELMPDAAPVLREIKDELARRPAAEISIIGHTDAQSSNVAASDKLSLARAEAVKAQLAAAGIDVSHAEVIGRGAREPLRKETDEAATATNRRVEINIR